MTRLPDWRARLTAYLAGISRRPFQQGRHDCALFTGGGVEAMTGADPFARVRGRYTTTRGGLRIMRRMGYYNHVAYLASLFAAAKAPLIGDIAIFETDEGPAVGLYHGHGVYALTETGVGVIPVTTTMRFLRV